MSETEQETQEPEAPEVDETEEAEEADSEEGTTAQPEPDESAGSGESGSALTEKELLARDKKLDAERTRHADRLSQILGEEWVDVTACPVCIDSLVGYLYDHELAEPQNELLATVKRAILESQGVQFKSAPGKSRCDACDGYGQVRTGSRMPQHDLISCAACLGNGYVPPPGAPQNGTLEQAGPQPILTAVPAAAEEGDKDIFGSPRLLDDGQPNPNYGKMIQYKDPNLP